MTEPELIALLQKTCDEWGGVTSWARHVGVSRQLVNDVLKGRRKVGNKIPRLLGLYKKKPEYDWIKNLTK